jgi:serine phosphatase RsbU (regulator of sigma subunit)
MSAPKVIEIRSGKRMIIFILVFALFIFYKAGIGLYDEIMENSILSISFLIDSALLLFFATISGFASVYAVKRLRDRKPGLILNNLGIIDNSGFVSAGTIFWSDVEEINSNKIIFSDCIIVKVKNPASYIRRQKSYFKRSWLGLEHRYFGSPVNISVGGLKIKFKDLFRLVQQQYMASHVETRTYELKREKDVIQREKKELVDSINYAKRIQTALLPSHSDMEKYLGESFILFIPKDIVSGDFYWVETVDEWVFFSVCDCTGHGVPGALISIVCNNALNRAVKEFGIIHPAKILDKVAELIIESIGVDGEVRDGMDASICAFNKKNRELFWAGANLPIYIAREDVVYELLEFKPDKQAIGLVENRIPYTGHKIDIKKGDILYLFSDGYADQFGGEFGKKLTRKKFKEQLLLQRGKPLKEQQVNLLKFHNEYRKSTDQIDDILILGIRIEQ